MNGSFAAWLSSWSRQTPRKSRYISSTTGRIPAIAAPTPRPMIAVSEIGVSRTRSPNRSCEPAREPEDVAAGADVDAGDEHALVGRRARPRARRGSRPSCGTPARRRRAAGGSARAGRARTTKSVSVAGGRARQPPGRVDRLVELVGHRRLERLDRVVADAGGAEPARVDDAAGRAPPTPAPRRATGSAAGRPRSGRASGRWRPRR